MARPHGTVTVYWRGRSPQGRRDPSPFLATIAQQSRQVRHRLDDSVVPSEFSGDGAAEGGKSGGDLGAPSAPRQRGMPNVALEPSLRSVNSNLDLTHPSAS